MGGRRTNLSKTAARPSWALNENVRKSMQSNRPTGSKPEVTLQSKLRRIGLRFRTNYTPFADRRLNVDVAFPALRVAVLVHGCFWHGCARHRSIPLTNRRFWKEKIAGNRARDLRAERLLRKRGWKVLTVWEHEAAESAAQRIERRVRSVRNAALLR